MYLVFRIFQLVFLPTIILKNEKRKTKIVTALSRTLDLRVEVLESILNSSFLFFSLASETQEKKSTRQY